MRVASNERVRKRMSYVSIISVSVLLTMSSACTKHYATAVTADKAVPTTTAVTASVKTDTLTAASLADSLIGTWKIQKTEIPEIVSKMMTYGSQAEKDAMILKQKQYQGQFMGLTATFKTDKTYETTYSGQTDAGTWRVNRKKEIESMSSMGGTAMTFQVLSLSGGVLVAKYDGPDIVLLLTFTKQ